MLQFDVILLDVIRDAFDKLDCVISSAPSAKHGEDGTVGRSLSSNHFGSVGCVEQADL